MSKSTSLAHGQQTVTLHDVASRVGVAPMTVSRALTGGHVSQATREAVLKAANELGYRPNMAARHMKSGKSRQIGVLVRNNARNAHEEIVSHPVAYEFVIGISEGLEEADYMMSFVRLSDLDEQCHYQSSAFQGHLLDGVIVVNGVSSFNAERLEVLFPHTIWLDCNEWRPTGCLRRDEHHAGETAAGRLAELGYRKWIVLDIPKNTHFSFARRRAGIKKAARKHGAEVSWFKMSWHKDEINWNALWAMCQQDVGVIAMDFYIAGALKNALLKTALRPGSDFALVCTDYGFNSFGIEWDDLSHVAFDRLDMGREAAKMLIKELNGESPAASVLHKGRWMERETARPCPK